MSGVLKTLPYPMQIGSGTYDLILGYNYQKILEESSYGFKSTLLRDSIIIVKAGNTEIEERYRGGCQNLYQVI